MTTERQLTDTVIMIKPDFFGFNPQTALDNSFQHIPSTSETETKETAISEFSQMVNILEKHDMRVVTLNSPLGPNGEITPDAIFPNNWVSTHPETLVLYPMKAQNRRWERQPDVLKDALFGVDVLYPQTLDLTRDEDKGLILEGTGSLVLDRASKIAYALGSQRTNEDEFKKWARIMGYEPHFFHATDFGDKPIYHTNVVMSVGEKMAVVCLGAVKSPDERISLENRLEASGKEVINITMDQMYNMCGNVLQTTNTKEENLIIMSERARKGFGVEKMKTIEKHGLIVPINIDTIETVGGGSARCMMAEVFYK